MFARRHYEAIAHAMQDARLETVGHAGHHEAINICCNSLADMFARDNGQFKRDRFIAACEPGANVKKRT